MGTINLDLSTGAEQRWAAVNPAHVTHVRLEGSVQSVDRKLKIYLVDRETISVETDSPEAAERLFNQVIKAVNDLLGTEG